MVRIMFDAYTPADIQLYTALGKDLRTYGWDVLYVIPDNEECINLMNVKNIEYKVIGARSSKGLLFKIAANLIRTVMLLKYINEYSPDVVVSRAVSTPFASKLLRKKVVMFIDNDAAILALLFTLPLADRIFMPKAVEMYGDIPRSIKKKTYFYNGIEEQIYLTGKIKEDVYEVLNISRDKNIIVVRPFGIITEYGTEKEDSVLNIVKILLSRKDITERYHIVLLPRNRTQREIYKRYFGSDVVIPDRPLDGESLLMHSKVFIGAGGTMSREAWLLGNIVFSLYHGRELSVERWLMHQKGYHHEKVFFDIMLKPKCGYNSKLMDREIIDSILQYISQVVE